MDEVGLIEEVVDGADTQARMDMLTSKHKWVCILGIVTVLMGTGLLAAYWDHQEKMATIAASSR